MARYDDLNTKMIAYATVLSIVVLILVLQGVQALSNNMASTEDIRKATTKVTSSDVIKREQLNTLDGYKKVSIIDELAPEPKKGESPAMKEVFQIPIESAQKIIIRELATSPALAPGT